MLEIKLNLDDKSASKILDYFESMKNSNYEFSYHLIELADEYIKQHKFAKFAAIGDFPKLEKNDD